MESTSFTSWLFHGHRRTHSAAPCFIRVPWIAVVHATDYSCGRTNNPSKSPRVSVFFHFSTAAISDRKKFGSTFRSGFQESRMAEREDLKNLSLLGKPETRLPSCPEEAQLEVFPNQRPGRKYWITLNCPEFSSLCPVTGQPDSARILIRYVPGETCVETKSLKFYLASFRNQPAFNEEIVNRILDDLVRIMKPQELVVRGEFAPRGGIQLTTEATYPEPS